MKTNGFVSKAVSWAVDRFVNQTIWRAVDWAVTWAVNRAVLNAVSEAADRAVYWAVAVAVTGAVDDDPPHRALDDFLDAADQGAP